MMLPIAVLFVFLISFQHSVAKCPPGEYDPGPDCAFEVICSVPAHSARRHYCDCWCNPGTVRDSITKKCVKIEECSYINMLGEPLGD